MHAETYQATIYVGGEISTIKETCREYCLRGLYVSVTPTEYIFTGGSEAGAMIGLINYPRFKSYEQLFEIVIRLS